MLRAERITAPLTHHGEGPFWDERRCRFLCMDVLAGAIVAIDSAGNTSRHKVPSPVSSVIRRRESGGFVVATEHGVVATDEELSTFEPIAELTNDRRVRSNDGGCDPLGAFVIGTMAYDARTGAGTVYRVTAQHEIVELLAPVTISNGVQWSEDGSRVFYIDTPTRRVDSFDVDPVTGAWSSRRLHVAIDESAGFPDGMAVDEEGGLWIALWGGGAVNHYDETGTLVETIAVPGATQVSSCAFGGEDGRTLYITTSRAGLTENEEADAGSVFAIATRHRGAMLAEFAG